MDEKLTALRDLKPDQNDDRKNVDSRRANAHARIKSVNEQLRALKRSRFGSTSECTPELVRRVCENIERGATISASCAAVGVVRSTFVTWLAKAKTGEEPYVTFAEAVEVAQARSQVELVRAAKDPDKSRGATFLLERRFRDDFGPKQEIDVNQRGSVTKIVQQRLETKYVPVDEQGRVRRDLYDDGKEHGDST